MVNQSKKNDPRFWRKWGASGAVSSGNKHFDKCMDISSRLELEGNPIEAGLMRVEAYNDHSHHVQIPMPLLGELLLLHQAYEGSQECLYCQKPINDWGSVEKCSARYDECFA